MDNSSQMRYVHNTHTKINGNIYEPQCEQKLIEQSIIGGGLSIHILGSSLGAGFVLLHFMQ